MMTERLPERSWESTFEKDDLVKLLNELHNRKGILEKALSTWQEKYSDVENWESAFGIPNLLSPLGRETAEMISTDENQSTIRPSSSILPDKQLRRRTSSRVDDADDDEKKYFSSENKNDSWCCDQYKLPELSDEDSYSGSYFEVTSLKSSKTTESEESDSSMQALLQRLKETKERVTAKCNEFDDTVSEISKAATESCSLRERIGMTHRSLTLIEMRQEKVMREALYENVTANCTIRRLHDEVIQLRIRDAQHQGDIQRLMAENNRLKLRLMEAKVRTPSFAKKTASNIEQKTPQAKEDKTEELPFSSKAVGFGDIDDLNKPVCSGAVQRGCLSLYKTKQIDNAVGVSGDIYATDSQERERKNKCPLCNRLPQESDFEDWEEKKTRTIGTSTADIENIVAPRTSVVVMGMILPIPLFLACLLRTIEESMTMIGRVCFAELPPCDPSFPELQGDVMEALSEMYNKIKRNIR